MKNNKIIALLCLSPILGFAAINDLQQERMKILSELNLPLPGSGIKLVPRSTFNLTEEEIQKGLNEERQMKEKGFIKEDTSRPKELIYFKNHAKSQIKYYINNNDDKSTHIRPLIKDLKLAFKFKGVPTSVVHEYLGVIPQGGFHTGGWSGAVQFFINKNIGACAYAQMNVAVSQTATELALEDANYLVNNKLSLIEVRGNNSSGYDYKIRWFDPISFHELECANMNYSAEITNQVIDLASKIDVYQ